MDKSKKLVAYFSCTGTTARAASALAAAANAELFEIKPKKPYSPSDLDWTSKKSRSSVEMSDESCRPEIAEKAAGMENYDTVFVGFPIDPLKRPKTGVKKKSSHFRNYFIFMW